ncbi:MAG: T9SS type A sorting domain-containing protein [Saprospiraceae bacterium]|nr:T9SS type A sorting domain-containing protein [Saprospiraceae bacterium]
MKTLVQTIALLFGTGILAAQAHAPFWFEAFSDRDSFATNWVDGGLNAGSQTWKWSDNPREATFGKQPVFAATSVANGYILFNSDANGNHPFQKSITSPPIDISDKKSLFVRFETQYGFFSKKGIVNAELGYSFNGTDFLYIPVLDFVPQNTLLDSVLVQIIQIPLNAPQQLMHLQFRWKGRYEYAWKIDDLGLYEENPRPRNDIALEYPKGAPNHTTPISQVNPMDFAVTVNNNGTAVQKNIRVQACVLFEGVEVFRSYADLPQLLPDSSQLMGFENAFTPKTRGSYTIVYQAISGDMDEMSANNTVSMPFHVSDNLFAKDDNNITGATQPSAPGSDNWQAGNLYKIQQAGYEASRAHISVMSPEGANGYEGAAVAVFLYEVLPGADKIIMDENLEIKGFGAYTFGSEQPFEVVEVDLFDISSGEQGIALEKDRDYLLSVQYPNHLMVPYSTLPYFYDYATIVKNNNWFPGGFGPGITVIARMEIQAEGLQTRVNNQLIPNAQVRLYPNPVSSYLHVTPLDPALRIIQYRIRDLQGRDLSGKAAIGGLPPVGGILEIPVHQLPAGTYILDLDLENGQKSGIPFIKK